MEQKSPGNRIEKILSKGADERIFLNEQNLTKYNMPLVGENVINRGSCTSSPATAHDVELIRKYLATCNSDDDWALQREKISEDLKRNLNWKGQDKFEVFFAPSGTDLVYFPLIFARLMSDRKILNITTCIEELGSGTRLASQMKFFSNYNQFGEKVPKGGYILEDTFTDAIFFDARSERGEILDPRTKITNLVADNPNHTIIINLVLGSKSGIEDNLEMIDEIKGENIIWNIDLCQFRHSKKIINALLDKNALVMLTGSKFYQSPPFSGALLLPLNYYKKLMLSNSFEEVSGISKVLSVFDFPKALRERLPFSGKINVSGILRWLCALDEISKYNQLDRKLTEQKITLWNKVVKKALGAFPEIEMMPQQDITNKTIVSFRLKVSGHYLSHVELKKLHSIIVTDNYSKSHGFEKLFIGQPVAYKDRSFLRLAIGSRNIRCFITEDEKTFELDKDIVSIVHQQLIKHYDHIS